MLYGREALCLRESEMGILCSTETSMVRAMCGILLKGRKRSTDLMFMLGLKKTMDQLAMANSVRWYGLVLRRDDSHVLKRALDFEVEGRGNKLRLKRTWQRQVEEESMIVGLRRKDALCKSKWSVGVSKIAAGLNLATLTYWEYTRF